MAGKQSGSSSGGSGGGGEDVALMGLVLLAILLIGGPIFYAAHKGGINGVIYGISRTEIFPFIYLFPSADMVWRFMDANPPQTVSFAQAKMILSISGGYARWIVAPLLIISGWMFYRTYGWIEKYTRQFTMKTLLERNANFSPCLRPVARRYVTVQRTIFFGLIRFNQKKKRYISDESTGTGPWRVAESPMLFALRKKVITDENNAIVPEQWCYQKNGLPRSVPEVPRGGYRFNAKVANQAFIQRIGPPAPNDLRDFQRRYPAYVRGLAGAFCAFGLGERDAGQRILDAMSDSFNEDAAIQAWNDQEAAGHFPINILTAESWLSRALKTRPSDASDSEADLARYFQRRTQAHKSFLYVWLGSMLEAARYNGGVLPALEFLWLRPTNRELWYFLSSLGGNAALSEGGAAWAHYRAEEVLGKPILYTAVVDEASSALRKAISVENWFDLHGESGGTASKGG